MKHRTSTLAAAVIGFSLLLTGCGGAEVTDGDPVDAGAATGDAAQETAQEVSESAAPEQSAGDDDADDQADDAASQEAPSGDTNIAAAIDAIATAEAENDGIAVQIDWEDRDEWEVEVVEGDREIEYRISADGGEVVDSRDEDDDDDDDRAAAEAASVSMSEAIQSVADEHGGDLESASIDDDDNRVGYEIEMREGGDDDREFWVDAESGEVQSED